MTADVDAIATSKVPGIRLGDDRRNRSSIGFYVLFPRRNMKNLISRRPGSVGVSRMDATSWQIFASAVSRACNSRFSAIVLAG